MGFVYIGSCETPPPDRPRPDVRGADHLDRRVSLFVDLFRALAQLADPRFLRVLLRALGLTVLALAAVFWLAVLGLGWLLPDSVSLPWIGPVGFLDDLAFWGAAGLMLLLSVVLMVPAAAAAVGFFLDGIAAAVEARYYPGLPPVTGLGVGQQAVDALRFFGLVVAANLVALVVYLAVPPLAPFVFWLVNGFLLGREYFQLVAMRRLEQAGGGGAGAAALLADLGPGHRDGGADERAAPEPGGADPRGRGVHPPVPPDGAGLIGLPRGGRAGAPPFRNGLSRSCPSSTERSACWSRRYRRCAACTCCPRRRKRRCRSREEQGRSRRR